MPRAHVRLRRPCSFADTGVISTALNREALSAPAVGARWIRLARQMPNIVRLLHATAGIDPRGNLHQSRSLQRLMNFLATVFTSNLALRQGAIDIHVPKELIDPTFTLEELIPRLFPVSHRLMVRASEHELFDSLPVAFDPGRSVGPYTAVVDEDALHHPYRFLDFGGFGAKAFGDNRPDVVLDLLAHFSSLVDRYPHSEYQTKLSLEFAEVLGRLAPYGCSKAFLCNTGAESVENAIKAALFKQELDPGDVPTGEHAYLIHFSDAFHGRSLGALAATRSKKARHGFPTFDWPAVTFPAARFENGRLMVDQALQERELASLKEIWSLFVLGRNAKKNRPKKLFEDQIRAIDLFLQQLYDVDLHGIVDRERREALKAERVKEFLAKNRPTIPPKYKIHAENVTGIIAEPVQGEGGIRIARARYFQQLRLLSLLYDVPLIFDEVQTGFGRTGTFWAYEQFDLPAPPDIVVSAKIAQMGIVFVSDTMAHFFEAEKRFNTTWAGEPAGMVRVMRYAELVHLPVIMDLAAYAMDELITLQQAFRSLVVSVRGRGLMIGLSLSSPQIRDALQEQLFRRGLILNRAGEEALRFYPRFDSNRRDVHRAVQILFESLTTFQVPLAQNDVLRRAA